MSDVDGYDVEEVRARFPALTRTQDGQPYAYFDGPGGSQVPQTVAAAMAHAVLHANANRDGAFATSAEGDAIVATGRIAAADMLGGVAEEIAFGPNMTTLNYLLAHAVARTMSAGDEIVTTELDHDANVAPWLQVADDHGLVVRQARLHRTDGTLDVEHLESLLSPRTRVVAFTLASNALGTVPPVERIVHAAHRVGALAWADGVHCTPHRRLDREQLGIDVLLSSPYKWFGPHLGVASIRRDLAATLPADRVRPAEEEPVGHRFETGTQSIEAIAGMIAAVEHLAGLGVGGSRGAALDDAYARIGAHERALTLRFLEGVAVFEHVRLLGLTDPGRVDERVATFSFTVEGAHPREVAQRLADRGMAVWDGNFYALSALQALDLERAGGAVRVGFLHYTTADEVDRLLEALGALA